MVQGLNLTYLLYLPFGPDGMVTFSSKWTFQLSTSSSFVVVLLTPLLINTVFFSQWEVLLCEFTHFFYVYFKDCYVVVSRVNC